jgi:cupin fold WbuC family metalloprotein
MNKIYSRCEPNKLCHLVNRLDEITERTNVADDHQFLQLATLKMNQGQTFQPHQHIWKPSPTQQVIAQESWMVFCGSVEVSFFDIDGQLLEKQTLYPGDCSMTFEGGHTYLILQDNTIVYEYKTGPYQGQQLDKVFI